MNTLIWNKIAAALILSLLLYKGIEIFADGAFEVAEPATRAYVVAGLEAAAPEPVAAPEEVAPAPADDIMALLAVASPEQGKRIFRRCQACHDVSQDGGHKIGPNLYGVMGAAVAQHDDFRYSDALAGQGGNWDFAAMDAWLTSPAGVVPGNKMSFGGMPKAGDRAALIAYMNSNSDAPLALPAAPAVAEEAAEEVVEDADAEVMEEAVSEEAMPANEDAAPEAAEEVMEEAAEETAVEPAVEPDAEPAEDTADTSPADASPEEEVIDNSEDNDSEDDA